MGHKVLFIDDKTFIAFMIFEKSSIVSEEDIKQVIVLSSVDYTYTVPYT